MSTRHSILSDFFNLPQQKIYYFTICKFFYFFAEAKWLSDFFNLPQQKIYYFTICKFFYFFAEAKWLMLNKYTVFLQKISLAKRTITFVV